MLKNKMSQNVTEWNDIVEPKYAPQAPEKSGADIYRGGVKNWYEPNKRNEIINRTYESVGELTGKKGYSKSTANKYSSELRNMKRDINYGAREAFDYFGKK
jgi:ABC-type phosphate transport system substrate-binding protein